MAAASADLLPFTDRVCALSNASSFAAFVEPLSSKPGATGTFIDTLCHCFLSSRKGDVETAPDGTPLAPEKPTIKPPARPKG